MLAIRREETVLTLHPARPQRASIGARRNPDSTRAILEAAEQILLRDGLAGFSMDAIARQAQCGKPTLYRWWPEKAGLLAELHRKLLPPFPVSAVPDDQHLELLTQAWRNAWDTTLAGLALCGMVAEAQHSEAARSILNEQGLAPYRESLAARSQIGQAELEPMLRELLHPLLGELLISGDVSANRWDLPARPAAASRPAKRAVMREIASGADQPPESHSLRDRSEWVD